MYLSEGKRAEIRECIKNQRLNPKDDNNYKINHIQEFHNTAGGKKVSQILFDARDGKEVFTPF